MKRTVSQKTGIDKPYASKAGGFALLVTIVLVSFLVLILVSLATFTRVETQVASNAQKLDAARNHALLALNIAIGQLQQNAGPDSRISAQANLLDANAANPWFTGIWTADAAGNPTLRSWLVSGNETVPLRFGPDSALGRETASPDIPLTLAPNGLATNGPETANPNRVQLVGSATAGSSGYDLDNGSVVVPGVPINAPAPGTNANRTVGRYAYWVGDQGVKASLVLPDRADEVTYAPWYDPTPGTGYDQRARIRQQIATTPTFFRRLSATEEHGFDPLDTANETRLPHVLNSRHFDLLKPAVATAPLDTFRRDFFHTFTDRAYAVLANTLPLTDSQRGLQRDLSLAPSLLGPAFVAQSNLTGYMETPSATNTAVPPITSYDSPRRRYTVSPVSTSPATSDDPEIEFKVAPVLNSLLLQFKVFRNGTTVGVRSRIFTELWNPYSAALVPDDLFLEITGLPQIQVTVGADPDTSSTTIDLQDVPSAVQGSGSPVPMRMKLTFATGAQADFNSWLPGRIYAWHTPSGDAATAELEFYDKSMGVTGWTYPANPTAVAATDAIAVESSSPCSLVVKIKNAAGDVLATYTSPEYPPFGVLNTNSGDQSNTGKNWAFGFGFRLNQPSIFNQDRDWLSSAGQDFRSDVVPANALISFHENLDIEPTAYSGTFAVAGTDMENYLLFRKASTGTSSAARNSTRSANLDAPVFELPRLPYLSVGELQHLLLPAERPFAAGNSWGGKANSWFDRFFFSGLTTSSGGPDLAAGQPLPNWNLQPLSTSLASDGALSSQHLLQAGGFNVNSALPEAWRAVLSGVRFSTSHPFSRATIDNSSSVTDYTGSQPDPAVTTTAIADEVFNDTTLADDADPANNPVGGPAFFRFPQSAQETYYWEDINIDGDFKKQAFRQGVRGGDQAIDGSTLQALNTTQIDALADAITTRLRAHAATSGPYRSLQDFLAPNAAWSDHNLLEQAIEDVNINPTPIAPVSPAANLTDIGFSSLTLTSGDIMTALTPYLRTRSDTFIIRTYGEALNLATGEVASRAWCEATVQRFPETVAPTDDIAAPSASGFGRKFHITRFRWLSPSDI